MYSWNVNPIETLKSKCPWDNLLLWALIFTYSKIPVETKNRRLHGRNSDRKLFENTDFIESIENKICAFDYIFIWEKTLRFNTPAVLRRGVPRRSLQGSAKLKWFFSMKDLYLRTPGCLLFKIIYELNTEYT